MSHLKRRKINQDEKRRVQTYLYHCRSNCNIKNLTKPTGDRYLIQLTTFADPNKSLADIFLYFSHSIFEIGPYDTQFDFKIVEFNKLFVFMVELFHLHERYLPEWIKKTEEINESVRDIIGRVFVGKDEQTKKIIQSRIQTLYQKSLEKVKKLLKDVKSKLLVSDGYVSNLQVVRVAKQKMLQRYHNQILMIQDPKARNIYISTKLQDIASAYLRKLLNTLVDVQFSRRSYRHFRMMDFMKSYKDYLNTDFIEHDRKDHDRYILVKRYSSIKNTNGSNKSQILMNLYQMVQLRKKGDYFDVDIQIVKKLGLKLRKHKKDTQKSYPLLNPKYIIFDQISLEVHLSYQAPLLAALGLLKMPCSLEQATVFSATPQVLDPFSSPEQHLPSSDEEKVGTGQQIFYDALYGVDFLVDQYDPRYKYQKLSKPLIKDTLIFMKDVKTEREKISQAWRFVMIASFLLNRREYFKIKTQPHFDYTRFKQFLEEEQAKCKKLKPKGYAVQVIGIPFVEQLKKAKIQLKESEDMSLTIFDSFLGVDNQVSQISLQSRFYKANMLIRHKRMLKKQLMDVLQNNKQMNTMANVTRYFVAVYFLLFEICSYIQMVGEYYVQNFIKGRELLELVKSKINMAQSEESEDQDAPLNKAYRKLKQYESKRSENIKYIHKNYEKEYFALDINKKSILELRKSLKQIIFGEQSQESKNIINEILSENRILLIKLQKILIDAMQREFPRQNDKTLVQQPRKALFVNYFHVKMRLFILFNHDNHTTLDSLVSPFLASEKEPEDPAQLAQLYEYALQILKEYESSPHKTGLD